jgi:hypothetical protein
MTKPTHEEKCTALVAQLAERRAAVPVIDSPAAAQWAVDEALAIKAQREGIEALTAPGIKAADQAHKAALAARDRFTKPMLELERTYTREVQGYQATLRERTRRELAAAASPSEVAAAVALVTTKPEGFSERAKPWSWALVSLLDLVRAVAEGRAPLDYLTTNDGAIGRAVRSAKDAFAVPGIRTWVERTGVLRS